MFKYLFYLFSIFIVFLNVISLTSFTYSQNNSKILLVNCTLHVGNGEIITNATIGIIDSKISLIKNSLTYKVISNEWDTIIDVNNQHVYPGFVAPNSTLGLSEIEAIRASNDFKEVGEFNPHIRALIAYNVESKVISTVKTNGVLITQATPRGGIISGSSSLMFLDGWNWEDAVISADDGIHLNWPNPFQEKKGSLNTNDITNNSEYIKNTNQISFFFQSALNYSKLSHNNSDAKKTTDIRFESMVKIFKGTKRVYFHANNIQQLLDIIEFTRKFEIKYPVIIGGYDTHLCSDRIKDSKIPIMLPRLHSLPIREDDPIDLPFKLPKILFDAGIKFCLQNEGDMEAMNARNIPFLAGTAFSYGLPYEEAVKSITLNPCEIMGIEKDFGSIEIGKNATLFVSKGNALDMRTNEVNLILINGKFSSTSNFQTELYQKYKKKYQ
jgi:hypothetical protein